MAQRVLLATGERLGILTYGLELRLIISDPARVDSQVTISVDPHSKRSRDPPDSVRPLIALAWPACVKANRFGKSTLLAPAVECHRDFRK